MEMEQSEITNPIVNEANEPMLFDEGSQLPESHDASCCDGRQHFPVGDPALFDADEPASETGSVARLRRQPFGSISIDMDTLSDYAGGYGFAYDTKPDPVYTRGLSRFLDIFGEQGIRATIFVIGRDAV